MPRRSSRALVTATGVHALLLAGVSPAVASSAPGAPPSIGEVKVRPEIVVLPASNARDAKTSFAIVLQVKDSDGVDTVVVGLYPPGAKQGIAVRADRTGGTAAAGTWTARVRLGGGQSVGTWKVQAFATDREQRTTDPSKVVTEYQVRTPTRVSGFGVGEPVEPGAAVKVAGVLQRWAGKDVWVPYPDREVTLEFRAAGAKKFDVVDTFSTRADGSVADAKGKAEKAGTWRIAFAGADTRAAAVSREDEVAPVEKTKEEPKADAKPSASPSPSPSPTTSSQAEPAAKSSAKPNPTPSSLPSQPETTSSAGSPPTGKGPANR